MTTLTLLQQCTIIGLCALATQICRFLPFIIFSKNARLPQFIVYLGGALPLAVFGMLLVYCVKDINLLEGHHGVPEFIAIVVTALIQVLKRNMMISMAIGTVLYMILVQYVFK